MFLCRRLGDHRLSEVAAALGVSSYSTVSMSIRRLREKARDDPNLDTMLSDLETKIRRIV
jgi:chromosomal replication initiation ATPase DnaA